MVAVIGGGSMPGIVGPVSALVKPGVSVRLGVSKRHRPVSNPETGRCLDRVILAAGHVAHFGTAPARPGEWGETGDRAGTALCGPLTGRDPFPVVFGGVYTGG